jgi:plasmid stabilization system protein ParE
MALKLSWTPGAITSLEEIFNYIEQDFGHVAAEKFATLVSRILDQLVRYPNMYPGTSSQNVRRGVIGKHTTIYYRIEGDMIELLLFWNNRKLNPLDL